MSLNSYPVILKDESYQQYSRMIFQTVAKILWRVTPFSLLCLHSCAQAWLPVHNNQWKSEKTRTTRVWKFIQLYACAWRNSLFTILARRVQCMPVKKSDLHCYFHTASLKEQPYQEVFKIKFILICDINILYVRLCKE